MTPKNKLPDKEIVTTEGDVINLTNYSAFWSKSLKSNSKDMVYLEILIPKKCRSKIFWPDN